MIKAIPAKLLRHSVTLHVCSGCDRYQKPTYVDTAIAKCLVQTSNETRKTKDNTEVVLRGLLIVDVKRSTPKGFDFEAAKTDSEAMGHNVTVTFGTQRYTVQTVETLYDDVGSIHHYEMGLV